MSERDTGSVPRQVRHDGPTPAGGAYMIALYDPSGRYVVEVAEYNEAGEQIARTHCAPPAITVRLTDDEYDEALAEEGIEFRQPKRPSPSPPGPPPSAKTPVAAL